MGVERFLLASTITAIVAQRLVRRLCSECKTAYTPDSTELRLLGLSGTHRFYRANGCEKCHGIGYTGRIGLYEMVEMDDKIRAMIHDAAREQDMERYAFSDTDTLLQSGARHVAEGTASAEEVLRVCRETSGS